LVPIAYLPQLATLARTPPTGDQWIHEIKLDGYRVGCLISNGSVKLVSRSGRDWTSKFPGIVGAAGRLGVKDALIDGELAVVLPDGRTSFEAMQQAAAGRTPRGTLVYFAFDLLRLEGTQVDHLPLVERKARLRALLEQKKVDRIRYTEHIEGNGPAVFEEACRLGLEGIVSKRKELPYLAGRREGWLKIKCQRRGLFVVGGFTDQEGSRSGLGALLVGRYDGRRLVFCGRVGTGFSHALSSDLRKRLEATAQQTCPFDPVPPRPLVKGAHWVKPAIVCEATFTEWTEAGVLRHPAFQALRPDVEPRQVTVSAT
jgi:bifunctional non-homologous end joining protein LigD